MTSIKKPDWLKVKIYSGSGIREVEDTLKDFKLRSVCREAKCPNRGECYSNKTATFIILGDRCTRGCSFCNISKKPPLKPDLDEPKHLAQAVKNLGLKYVVITSVTRDDLDDGGAEHFYRTIKEVKESNPGVDIEVLIPDFKGNKEALKRVVEATPLVVNHNMESVERLYPLVRSGASYSRSLKLLEDAKSLGVEYTKSGFILGLGEEEYEVVKLLKDLRGVKCDLLTIGQYLSPSENHYPVQSFIKPDQFKKYEKISKELGFKGVKSGPFVRSSYSARSLICTT